MILGSLERPISGAAALPPWIPQSVLSRPSLALARHHLEDTRRGCARLSIPGSTMEI